MLSPDQIFKEMERERFEREQEIRLLDNAAAKSASTLEQESFRRSVIVITYSHLEGFCQFALGAYVAAVNSVGLKCTDASHALVAASLSKALAGLRHPSSKHPVFARALPDDTKLHLAAREREFVEKYAAVFSLPVNLPDDVIDLESNLNGIVLKKNLYTLGLDYTLVDAQKANMDKLLGIRNAIAHGDAKVPSKREVKLYTALAFQVMQFVQYTIFDAVKNKSYLRAPAPP